MSSSKSNTRAVLWRSELKTTLKVATPMILGQIGQISMTVTDSLMVGHLGATPLAASAFVSNVVSIPMVFLFGISSCISVKVSQAYGAREDESIAHYFYNGLILTMLATVLTVVALLLGRNHLEVFRQQPEVIAEAVPFYVAISVSLLPMLIYSCAKAFCDSFSNTVPGMIVLVFGLVANIILNWVFIYGKWGFSAMGLTGSGYATLCARLLMAIIMVAYVFRTPLYKYYLRGFFKIKSSLKVLRELGGIGIPSGLQYLFEVGAFAGSGIMIGWISTQALAAHQIAINLASVTFMFAMGMSLASSVRVGQAKGRGDWAAVRTIGYSSLIFVGLVETFFAIMFFALKDSLPHLYVTDLVVIQFASQLLIIAALFQWFDGVQALALGLLRGLSDVQIPTAITFASYWLIGLPLAAVLAFYYDYDQVGIWVGLLTALGFAAGLLTWRFVRKTRLPSMTSN